MIRYVLRDIGLFLLLSFMLLIGFSFGFYLIFSAITFEGEEGFDSPYRSFETLYYSLLGEFDAEVTSNGWTDCMSDCLI